MTVVMGDENGIVNILRYAKIIGETFCHRENIPRATSDKSIKHFSTTREVY